MKRLFDFVIAVIALIFLCPVLVIVGLKVRQKLGSPVLFIQVRPGIKGRPFKMLKFRTMLDTIDSRGIALPDIDRLTPFGAFLRSTSLDELPELWNVVRGEMSLVGPRPLLMEYLPLYSYQQFQRHNVRPGITGWAQINGRNNISWDEKFKMDRWYVENRSFWLDVKILAFTVKKVICRDGVNAPSDVTMPRFNGNSRKEEDKL